MHLRSAQTEGGEEAAPAAMPAGGGGEGRAGSSSGGSDGAPTPGAAQGCQGGGLRHAQVGGGARGGDRGGQPRPRVRFAAGPVGDKYSTGDGHPDHEGRVARQRRSLGLSWGHDLTPSSVRSLEGELGEENRASLDRLKRRCVCACAWGGGQRGAFSTPGCDCARDSSMRHARRAHAGWGCCRCASARATS